MKKLILLSAILVAMVVLAAGCVTTTTTTSPTVTVTASSTPRPSVQSNDPHVLGGMEFHAAQVTTAPQALGSGGYFKPTAGNVFAAFNCTVKNINAPTYLNNRIGTSYWQLRDNLGNVYDAYSFASGTPGIKVFTGIDSKPGDVVSGYVFFEVPTNHGTWKSLTYDDGSREVMAEI